jgi:hypothetical protein
LQVVVSYLEQPGMVWQRLHLQVVVLCFTQAGIEEHEAVVAAPISA